MAFQVLSHAIANFSVNIGSVGALEGSTLRFCCVALRKHELRTLLVSAWYGETVFPWAWVSNTVTVPEEAKWVPHPNALA
jgi:hypothetical protein